VLFVGSIYCIVALW